jgi:hypothetical protein
VPDDVAPTTELTVRRALSGDRPEMIELCRAALGWHEDDPSERFFSWKHDQNPFGASPAWVAVDDDGRLAGVRVFMRWRFRGPDGVLRAVRAVDTATRPDMQGRGIFTRLTKGALPDLADEGTDLVFNTPNDQSRPGYLKMGWQVVGRVPVAMRPRGLLALPRVAGARAAASKWSEPSDVGRAAPELFADADDVARLLAVCTRPGGVATDRSVEYLQWRYSFDALHYRAVPLGDRLADGVVVFRLRRRGTAMEAAVCEVLTPSPGRERSAVAWLLRRSGADYALRCDDGGAWRAGFVPVPGLGPVLTWRPVASPHVPRLGDLSLVLGDVELF